MDGLIYGGHKIGDEISNKILVSYSNKNRHGHHMWIWKCISCNGEHGPSSISHLKRSKHCIKCNVGEKSGRWKGFKELTGVWLYQYQSDARKKGREFSVTPEQLWEIWIEQNGKCAYTGWKLTHGVDASLDRIDSAFGYVSGNVQWVHKDINRMKTDFPEVYFLKLCKEVTENQSISSNNS